MAKYDAHYSCGHSETVQLFGPEKDRQRKLAWYAQSGQCPACYKAAQEAKREAEAETAKAQVAHLGLAEVNDGTDKQIAWAERIRAEALASESADPKVQAQTAMISVARAAGKTPDHGLTKETIAPRAAAIMDAALAARAKLEVETSARWWIDNRDEIGARIANAAVAKARQEFAELNWSLT